jgi:hypothetical protein
MSPGRRLGDGFRGDSRPATPWRAPIVARRAGENSSGDIDPPRQPFRGRPYTGIYSEMQGIRIRPFAVRGESGQDGQLLHGHIFTIKYLFATPAKWVGGTFAACSAIGGGYAGVFMTDMERNAAIAMLRSYAHLYGFIP